MPKNCYVSNCNTRGSKDDTISFHRFPHQPKEPDRFQKWLDFCHRHDAPNGIYACVCSLHFTRDMYTHAYQLELLGSAQKRRLIPDAVPTEKGPTELPTREEIRPQESSKVVAENVPHKVSYTSLADLINDAANIDTQLLHLVLPVDKGDKYCVFYRSNTTGQSPSSAFERCLYFRNTLEPRVELLGREKAGNSPLPACDILDRHSLEKLLHWLDYLKVCQGISADDGQHLDKHAVFLDKFLSVPVTRPVACDLMFYPSPNRIRCPVCAEFQNRINKRKKGLTGEISNGETIL